MKATTLAGPPEFLALGAEPVRWGILQELVNSDRQVDELVRALDRPQNLVSYHLGKLRAARLVSARRSSHDARGHYYRLDLGRCRELLADAALALHPSLGFEGGGSGRSDAPDSRASVLFLCTENSARSQMAEGFLRAATHGEVAVASAGTRPNGVHPLAVRAMKKRGIDISDQVSKRLDDVDGSAFDLVVTVCDHVKETCLELPGAARTIHWSVPDPVKEGDDAGRLSAFDRVAGEIAIRIDDLAPVL